MRILLDTHALLWFHALDNRLSKNAIALIEAKENECYYSIISLWEIGIKHSLGKLKLVDGLAGTFQAMERSHLHHLSFEQRHILQLATMPLHHRDPFDRMLIAQAKAEDMHLLTADPHFAAYDVQLIKA
ncbi:MAG: type II toxin-antitoxin system VapC family toxin [Flavobacteriales bacterium]